VLETWPEDQDKARGMIEALPAALEQEAAMSKLLDAYPSEVVALCAQYASGTTRGRCMQISERPHLFSRLPPPRSTVGRLGGGPANSRLYPGTLRDSPYSEIESNAGPCLYQSDVNGCLWKRAQLKAQEGEIKQAVALCNAVPLEEMPPARWRSECMFLAAEMLVADGRHERYSDAIDMCMTGQLYRPNCLAHLLQELGREAPEADVVAPEGWARIKRFEQSVLEAWKYDPVREVMVSRLWSEATGHAYVSAVTVTGDPLDHVPEIAIPHVRAAAAWRLLELEGKGDRTLEGWVDALEAALERRSKPVPADAAEEVLAEGDKPARFKGKTEMWPRDQGEDAERPAELYLGTSRRTTSKDARTDLALVILETAARMEPPWTELLEAGSRHPAEPVQWTATRLTKMITGQADGTVGP
jgi:hypothetical protein